MDETEQKIDIRTEWEGLGISNDFIFGKVMQDAELCKGLLDSYVQRLAEAVERAKRNRKWRHEYMTLLMREQESFERGKTLGIEQEETRIILRLHESGYMAEQIADLLGKEIKKVEMVIKKKGMSI